LYLQNERNLEVCSIDISPNAIEACNQRGLKNTHVQNILEMDSDNPENKFDTILLLMNGTGILEH
jgi:methylase of polypeptide subunit release factors